MILSAVVVVIVLSANGLAVDGFASIVANDNVGIAVVFNEIHKGGSSGIWFEWASVIIIAVIAQLPIIVGIEFYDCEILAIDLERKLSVVGSASATSAFPVLFVFNADADGGIAGVGGGNCFWYALAL